MKIITGLRWRFFISLLTVLAGGMAVSGALHAQEDSGKKLDEAVAVLRHIDPDKKMSEEESKAKFKEVENAWDTIIAAGKKGIERLKTELAKIEKAKEKDEFFKVSAAGLLWAIGKLDQAAEVAKIWDSLESLTINYSYVFYPALQAARTQDRKALPMLKAILRDKDGVVYLDSLKSRIDWPMTHEFIWGAYGPDGLPELLKILKDSKDPVARQTAMMILADFQYLDALAPIRKLAKEEKGEVQLTAVRCLGVFGHPNDFEFLLKGLNSKDTKVLWNYTWALYEYEDVRAIPKLIPLLKSKDAKLRKEVAPTLVHLLTAESIEALLKYQKEAQTEEEQIGCKTVLESVFKVLGTTRQEYLEKSEEGKEKLIKAYYREIEDQYKLKAGDRKPQKMDFEKALALWLFHGRLRTGGEYDWFGIPQILACASDKSIDILLEVNAALYRQVSTERISEINMIGEALKHLGRRRYRKSTGLCEKVEKK